MRPIHLARQLSLDRSAFERTLQTRQREMAELQEHLITGRKVNRASDDATAFAQARRLDVLSDRYEQYQRTISGARLWVDETQEGLNDLADFFTNAYEDGVQARNDTLDDVDREALASSIESVLAEVLDQLNEQTAGEYLFAGTRTDAPPFVQDFGPGSDGAGVTYNGNDAGRTRAIGPGLNLNIGISGARVNDPGTGLTLAESLQELADAIRTGDDAQMETALENTITARDYLIGLGAEAGTLANRLDQADSQLGEATINVAAQRSSLEDADLAETLLAIQQNETSLQAALQTVASLQQQTLLDYLR